MGCLVPERGQDGVGAGLCGGCPSHGVAVRASEEDRELEGHDCQASGALEGLLETSRVPMGSPRVLSLVALCVYLSSQLLPVSLQGHQHQPSKPRHQSQLQQPSCFLRATPLMQDLDVRAFTDGAGRWPSPPVPLSPTTLTWRASAVLAPG